MRSVLDHIFTYTQFSGSTCQSCTSGIFPTKNNEQDEPGCSVDTDLSKSDAYLVIQFRQCDDVSCFFSGPGVL